MTLNTIINFAAAVAAALVLATPAFGAGNPGRGVDIFGAACAGCHSLQSGEHLTGPSLAGIVGRRAGTAKGYVRYSDALRRSNVTWGDQTLDAWLADPQVLIPGNLMTFPGIRDAGQRADLIAFLKNPQAKENASGGMNGMMSAPRLESLRDVEPPARVTAIRYCQDSYFVTVATGKTYPFWEFNLRLKTNGSPKGPAPGKPVILPAGMRGDRASIIFHDPDEISGFIRKHCE